MAGNFHRWPPPIASKAKIGKRVCSLIFLMRHGQSKANERNLAGTDLPLTETGRRQALNARLPHGVSTVVASSLKRAKETADIVARRLGLPVSMVLPPFNEIGFGRYDGHEVDEWFDELYLRDLPELCRQLDGDDPEERAKLACALLSDMPDGTLVVTSDTLIRCMMGVLTVGHVVPLGKFPQIGNCAVIGFDCESGRFLLEDSCPGSETD